MMNKLIVSNLAHRPVRSVISVVAIEFLLEREGAELLVDDLLLYDAEIGEW